MRSLTSNEKTILVLIILVAFLAVFGVWGSNKIDEKRDIEKSKKRQIYFLRYYFFV